MLSPNASPMHVDVAVAGSGPPVVLVHSSVSGNRQWKKLTALLGARYRVVAPNLTGYGGTPAWHDKWPLTVPDAANVVLAVCAPLEAPLRLVGHSWGATLALWAARELGPKVSHIAVYEPMLAGLLASHGRTEAAADAAAMHADVRRLGGEGRWSDLGRRFTDYFGGEGAWDASPPARQEAIAAGIAPNVHEWEAATVSRSAEDFDGISAQVLLMCGTETPLVPRETAALLARRFPAWRFEQLPGCAHMAPISQPDLINSRVAAFLDSD